MFTLLVAGARRSYPSILRKTVWANQPARATKKHSLAFSLREKRDEFLRRLECNTKRKNGLFVFLPKPTYPPRQELRLQSLCEYWNPGIDFIIQIIPADRGFATVLFIILDNLNHSE